MRAPGRTACSTIICACEDWAHSALQRRQQVTDRSHDSRHLRTLPGFLPPFALDPGRRHRGPAFAGEAAAASNLDAMHDRPSTPWRAMRSSATTATATPTARSIATTSTPSCSPAISLLPGRRQERTSMGDLMFALVQDGKGIWLQNASDITSKYRPGRMEWIVKDAAWGATVVHLEMVPGGPGAGHGGARAGRERAARRPAGLGERRQPRESGTAASSGCMT